MLLKKIIIITKVRSIVYKRRSNGLTQDSYLKINFGPKFMWSGPRSELWSEIFGPKLNGPVRGPKLNGPVCGPKFWPDP